MQTLLSITLIVVASGLTWLLLRVGVRWRIAMVLPAIMLGGLIFFTLWQRGEMTSWWLAFSLAVAVAFYISMLITWRLFASMLREAGIHW